jgi:hypothetical protein
MPNYDTGFIIEDSKPRREELTHRIKVIQK